MKSLISPPVSDQVLARRGIFNQQSLRTDLEKLISAYANKYYRLRDGVGQMHFMVDSGVLLPLIDWLAKYPKLACKVQFTAPRKPLTTTNRVSVAALSDADVLSISKLHIIDAAIFLHIYDKLPKSRTHVSRTTTAPMRTVNFADLNGPYRGYRIGKPACVISRKPIKRSTAKDLVLKDDGPIDVVYTWVDSDDPDWQKKFAKHVGRATTTTHASELRYLSRDELRYSLRSVLKHAPWVRNIYIVTDDQCPEWFRGNDRVKIVNHREIFPDPSVLPVFNSHAIESCLHRIPGLAERFIYFNDDVFLGRPVTPADFFGPDGSVKLFFSSHLSFNPEFVAHGTLPTDAAFRNTIRLIEARFDMTPIAKVLHTPHPMRKSVLEMIEQDHVEEIALTRAARIRSETDLNVTGNLAYYYYLGLGLGGGGPEQDSGFYSYLDTGRLVHMKMLMGLIRRPAKFFCLNLTHHHEVPLRRQAQLLWLAFRILFPRRAQHERGRITGVLRSLFRRGDAKTLTY